MRRHGKQPEATAGGHRRQRFGHSGQSLSKASHLLLQIEKHPILDFRFFRFVLMLLPAVGILWPACWPLCPNRCFPLLPDLGILCARLWPLWHLIGELGANSPQTTEGNGRQWEATGSNGGNQATDYRRSHAISHIEMSSFSPNSKSDL